MFIFFPMWKLWKWWCFDTSRFYPFQHYLYICIYIYTIRSSNQKWQLNNPHLYDVPNNTSIFGGFSSQQRLMTRRVSLWLIAMLLYPLTSGVHPQSSHWGYVIDYIWLYLIISDYIWSYLYICILYLPPPLYDVPRSVSRIGQPLYLRLANSSTTLEFGNQPIFFSGRAHSKNFSDRPWGCFFSGGSNTLANDNEKENACVRKNLKADQIPVAPRRSH